MCLAIPAKILEINGDDAKVDYGGIIKTINISLVEVKMGDYILIHAGFAIQTINKDEAVKTLETLQEFEDVIKKNK
ncbi:HypC/HybG/HupF family hydrogenase formation chaperone [Candidatus Woesearchaeota archaeon]|nr:MAG: HypC/HybG/HupF family hydrogenase formation chaperone [Candidatus Woesearchaeota archaeon]